MDLRRVLLGHAIDYAGLFPPAARPMPDAVERYAEHRRGPDAWALGRFVVTASRLEELAAALLSDPDGAPWPLSVVGSGDLEADLAALDGVTAPGAASRVRVEAIEVRAGGPGEIPRLLARLPDRWERFVEVPLAPDPSEAIATLHRAGAGVKFRTGGLTAELFPDPDDLLRGLSHAVAAGLPFKCTAGLHHPVRGWYPVSYAPGAPRALMYGYLNVFLTAAALAARWDDPRAVLVEEDPTAFEVGPRRVAWRGHALRPEAMQELRRRGLRGFGSCSFREPVDELRELATA